jgi:phosphatidate cytidylyltransferase
MEHMMERILSSISMSSFTLFMLYTNNKDILVALLCAASCTEIINICGRINFSIEETFLACSITLLPFVAAAYAMTTDVIVKILCIVWASDSGALITGNLLGGPKFGSISPKKRYSGLFGGILCGFAASSIVKYDDSIENVLLICVATQVGDIIESAAKRLADIKDSNVYFTIPGHGGLLDRIDGLLLALPIACILKMIH